MDEKLTNEVLSAMAKKAKGYDSNEVVEEYQGEEGNMVLTKKKVTTKHYPPDTSAAKLIMEFKFESDLEKLTDEELKKEKIRLLNLLKELENEN